MESDKFFCLILKRSFALRSVLVLHNTYLKNIFLQRVIHQALLQYVSGSSPKPQTKPQEILNHELIHICTFSVMHAF